jgi:hypothetical protein
MDLYTIIFILFIILVLGIIMGALFFIIWLDKKIDTRERMGQSAYKPKTKKEDQNSKL